MLAVLSVVPGTVVLVGLATAVGLAALPWTEAERDRVVDTWRRLREQLRGPLYALPAPVTALPEPPALELLPAALSWDEVGDATSWVGERSAA